MGSPPRMRGKARGAGVLDVVRGITPAYAGKSFARCPVQRAAGDHPRVCGEKRSGSCIFSGSVGSPPRMRGKGVHQVRKQGFPGITPAYAGKRPSAPLQRACGRDHPRVCGEKWGGVLKEAARKGSPPRMRGKVVRVFHLSYVQGITPAYAGKSLWPYRYGRLRQDHPRVCGEKWYPVEPYYFWGGSPPRMRGKGAVRLVLSREVRITPAYAGKRHERSLCRTNRRDHPRVCGEKPDFSGLPPFLQGSPPRMRGKAFRPAVIARWYGITPAYAGKSAFCSIWL